MGFTDELRRRAEPIWRASREHPFVLGIGDGSLPVEKFKFYIRQDYVFLIDFSRVLALGAARAHEPADMARFASLLDATLNGEMDLHRGYCERFGISREELEAPRAAPTTYADTRHLMHIAESDTAAAVTASLIPCQLGYSEIGEMLSGRGEPSEKPLYGEWIRTYASQEMAEIAAWSSALLDRLASQASASERERIGEIFLT